jgi:hypothetical protein
MRTAGIMRNGYSAHLTAAFGESSIDDHDESTLVLTIVRAEPGDGLIDGLAFRFDLPADVTAAGDDIDNDCGGEAEWQSSYTTVTVTDAALGADVDSCSITVLVTSYYSGSYEIGNSNAQIDGGDFGADIDADTLVVTTGPAQLTSYFKSSTIKVGAQSTLRIRLYLSDQNETAALSGVKYRLTLPANVVIVAVSDNDCVGTLSAVAGSRIVTFSAGSLDADERSCDTSVKVTSQVSDEYELQSGNFTLLGNVELALDDCKMARASCSPMLNVEKLDQTVTFEQPAPRPVGNTPLAATATSGLTATFTSETPSVCTVSKATLVVAKEGVCTVSAGQPGNGKYAAAEAVSRTIDILPPPPAPPTVAADGGTSSIAVSWTAPEDTSVITGYTAMGVSGDITTSCTPDDAKLACVLGAVAGRPYIVWVVSRGPNGMSEKTIVSSTVTATEPVVPSAPPTTNLVLTTTDGDISTAEPGQKIVFVGKGFAPFSTVTITIYSNPTVLGTAVTNSVGSFSQAITVPPSLAVGAHTAVAQGVSPSGQPRSMALDITVAPAGGLPVTGTNVLGLIMAGLGSMLTGGVLLLAGRPRRRGLRAC